LEAGDVGTNQIVDYFNKKPGYLFNTSKKMMKYKGKEFIPPWIFDKKIGNKLYDDLMNKQYGKFIGVFGGSYLNYIEYFITRIKKLRVIIIQDSKQNFINQYSDSNEIIYPNFGRTFNSSEAKLEFYYNIYKDATQALYRYYSHKTLFVRNDKINKDEIQNFIEKGFVCQKKI